MHNTELHELGRDLDEKLGIEIEKNEKLRAHIKELEEERDYGERVIANLCKQMPGVERGRELLQEIARLRRALAGEGEVSRG